MSFSEMRTTEWKSSCHTLYFVSFYVFFYSSIFIFFNLWGRSPRAIKCLCIEAMIRHSPYSYAAFSLRKPGLETYALNLLRY